ncbi:outer membrane protein transport protein [Crocinitomicaceae bacterium]|nr:outer membrane protein transport protein [Crocinitomicaceae bacterium]
MRKSLRTYCLLGGCLSLIISPVVLATNGYFLIGYGAKSRSMGGTGIANPTDALAAGANPAGMSRVGTRIDFGAELFNPPRRVAAANGEFDFQTPTKEHPYVDDEESGSNLFLIPSFGMNYQFNRKVSVGMSVIGAGANTRYNDNFFELTGVPPNEPYGTLGVNLIQMQMLPTFTYKVNKNHAFGVSLAIGVQTFRAYGLGNFGTPDSDSDFQLSSDDSKLTNNGNDWSYGAGVRVGWLGNFLEKKLDLGAYYASRVYMTEFDEYSGLFAEEGDFDIPENYGIGIAIHPNKKFTLTMDVVQINYSDIASIGNPHSTQSLQDPCTRPIDYTGPCQPGNSPVPSTEALGAVNGMGFGWDDQTVYKIGASYQVNDNWIVRAGYNYGESPIPDDQLLFSMLAPAIIEQHLTMGFSYLPDRNQEWTVSYVHGFKHSQTCVAPGCVTMLTQNPGAYVAVEMEQDMLGVSYAYKF